MHGPSLAATLAAAVWLGLAPGPPADRPAPAEAIARARALIARDDAKGAVALLQDALPTAGADLGPMIVVLRQAYTRAADQAAKAGRAAEAEEYREDLQILNRRMRGKPDEPRPTSRAEPAPKVEAPAPRPEPAAPAPPIPIAKHDEPPRPRPEVGFEDEPPKPAESRAMAPIPTPLPVVEPTPTPVPSAGPAPPDPLSIAMPAAVPDREPSPSRPEPKRVANQTDPIALPAPTRPAQADAAVSRASVANDRIPPRDAGDSPIQPALSTGDLVPPAATEPPVRAPAGPNPAEVLKAADTAYLKALYLDANVHYTSLAKMGQLPETRKIHWAYCRSVEVVRRLKAKPTSAADWADIDREIAEIKALSPKYWYAEYLRNRAADMSRGAAKPAPAKGRVIRGAMPESDRPASDLRDLSRPAPAVPAQPPVGRLGKPGAFAMAVPSTDTPPVVTSRGESGRWKVKETANFVILHDDPALAESVAKAAEAARDAMVRRWTGSPPPWAWEPKCEVYLYPNAAIFSQVTGQPVESPGFSTMESDGVAVTGRRIKLRADAPSLVAAVVPHEVTHVLLADLFPVKPIPRWADEGVAVLSEPAAEQEKRMGGLDEVLDGGKVFSVENLMTVPDYPEGKYWPLYFAQSVSLTRFLVDQGKPGQFIDFLQGSQRKGVEPELKRVYGIENFADLQARWLAYARESSAARVAARQGETKTR